MNIYTEYSKQAELAMAAYGNFATTIPTEQELVAAGFSITQANLFIDKYIVIDQHSDATGLSATVFKSTDLNNPQTFLAIRGTNDPLDLLTDLVNIAVFTSLGSGLEKMSHDPSWVVRIEDPFFLFLIGI